jgi:hypothetical protein
MKRTGRINNNKPSYYAFAYESTNASIKPKNWNIKTASFIPV